MVERERDERGAIVGFSGIRLRPSPHSFEVGGRRLRARCAWDTLFLPAMLGAAAHVHSTCPITGTEVEITVDPDGIRHAEPDALFVSFPSAIDTDSANITGPSAVTSTFSPAQTRRVRGGTLIPITRFSTRKLGSRSAAAPSRR